MDRRMSRSNQRDAQFVRMDGLIDPKCQLATKLALCVVAMTESPDEEARLSSALEAYPTARQILVSDGTGSQREILIAQIKDTWDEVSRTQAEGDIIGYTEALGRFDRLMQQLKQIDGPSHAGNGEKRRMAREESLIPACWDSLLTVSRF